MACKLSLHQRKFTKGWRNFELHENGQLHISGKDSSSERSYVLDLQNLTHKTVVTRSSAWITLTFAWLIVAGLVGFAVFLLASNRRESAAGVLVLVGFVALILSPLLIGLFQRVRRNSYDVTIFHYRHGGQSAFSVFNNKPSRQEAQDFIQQLTKEIERAAPFEDKGEGLADQLGRLDALRSRGVLSEEEFASAKQRLLKLGVEEKRIGF
jgi:hypothetical protein